jgi:hypothetical protein
VYIFVCHAVTLSGSSDAAHTRERNYYALIHYKNFPSDAYAHKIDAALVPSPTQEEENEE